MSSKELEQKYRELEAEWSESNRNTIWDYTHGCREKFEWKCEKGHTWETTIANRVKGTKCPVCAGMKLLTGYNDLATVAPHLLGEWDYEKNESNPDRVLSGSHKKVWWICDKGHEYLATPGKRVDGTGCPYCANKKVLCNYNDLASQFPEIAAEWDYEHNGTATPQDVVYGSHKRFSWKCAFGHVWKCSVANRTEGHNCPYCTGRKVLAGFNDLKTLNPTLASEWDHEKNTINPDQVSAFSHKKVYWKCKDCGYSWYAQIKARHYGCGCPTCAKEKRHELTLANAFEKRPDLADEYVMDCNKIIFPDESKIGRNSKLWWKCKKGHVWEATLEKRLANKNCPYCAHKRVTKEDNLEMLYPELAKEWDYDKNARLPSTYRPYSNEKVWWKCENGHEWSATIGSRTRKERPSKCPYCSGKRVIPGQTDLCSTNPELAKEWDFERNKISPEMISQYSQRKVYWICPKGHSYKATVSNRACGRGCPMCKN